MKVISYFLAILLIIGYKDVTAQNVFDPNDPDVIFTTNNRPAQPLNRQIYKWGHTKSITSWNTFAAGFKSYFYYGMQFRLKFPKTYQPGVNDGKKYPVYVFLHGAGEIGGVWENEMQLTHGAQFHAQHVDNGDFDGFLIYPQHFNAYSGGLYEEVSDIIDSLAKYAKADVDRVIVGGLSSGGSSTYEFLVSAPKRWAAVTPISNAGLATNDVASVLSIPIWASNGGLDTNPYPQDVDRIVNQYTLLGGDVRHTFYPNQGHGVWNSFWAEPGYFQYLNDAHKAQPVVLFQHNEWCPGETVNTELLLQPGFYQYEWQKDNVTISGATSNSFTVTQFGVYRARFKRTSTSQWSDWSPRPVTVSQKGATVTPPITIDGMRSNVLPAPDGSTTVPLMVPNNYATYEWRRVSDNALVSQTNTLDAAVGQYKIRVNEQFGCSSVFSDPYTVVNANGANKPDKPTAVTAVTLSNTSIEVFWNNNPAPAFNETGFEIYRTTTAGTNYKLIAILPADSLLFKDLDLNPNTTYYYVVRAVNQYGAAELSNEASAKTLSDITPPTVPTNLQVVGVTRHSVKLSWSPSTDDVGIKNYEVYVNGAKAFVTPNTSFEASGLDSFVNISFYVRAVDLSDNKSGPSAQVTAFTKMNGISYSVYQGDWNNLPDFSTLTPVKQGINPNIDLSVSPYQDYFAIVWEGWINIPRSGTYTFYLSSDDGSAMYLDQGYAPDATRFINNDALQGNTEKPGTQSLTAGWHKFAVTYFEKTGDQVLTLKWSKTSPNPISKQTIPNSYFSDSQTGSSSVPAKPTNVSGTASAYNKVNISWQDKSSNETGFEVYRKAPSDADYLMVGLADVNATSFTDTTVSASITYSYRVQAVNLNGGSGFNAAVNVAVPAIPPAPPVPHDLHANAVSPNTITLAFEGSGQTGFEIQRSVGDDQQFRFFRTLETTESSITVQDTGLYGNTLIYYKVRALGSSSNSEFSVPVSTTTLNSQPKMELPGIRYIYYQGSSVIPVNVTDADGDVLAISVTGLPAFATFQNTGNGQGNIVLNPNTGNLGTYNINVSVDDGHSGTAAGTITLIVSTNRPPTFVGISPIGIDEGTVATTTITAVDLDRRTTLRYEMEGDVPAFITGKQIDNSFSLNVAPGYGDAGTYYVKIRVFDGSGGVDSANVEVIVNDVNPNTKIYVNVQSTTPAATAPWNNMTGDSFQNLLNSKGVASGVGISLSPSGWYTSADGATTGNNSGVYPDAVMRDNYYFGLSWQADTVWINLTGLEQSTKYRIALFSSSTNAQSQGGTVFATAGLVRTAGTYNNTSQVALFNELMSGADGTITVKMYKATGTQIGYLNAVVIEKLYEDGTTPAAPGNLTAQALENGFVKVSWKNFAYNALGYGVLRSTTIDGQYDLISGETLFSEDSTFIDSNLIGGDTYFYKVFAYNDFGNSDTVGIAQATTLNKAPAIQNINNVYMKSGTNQSINVVATDDPGDVLTITVTGLPAFATFQNTGNGTGTINIQPGTGIDGVYDNVTVKVSDAHGASAQKVFNISVSDNLVRTVKINFNSNEPAPWNNYQAYPNSATTLSNLKDDLNATTPFSFKFTTTLSGTSTWEGMNNANEGIYSDNVLKTGVIVSNTNTQTMQFSGLDPAKKYNVVIISSYNQGLSSSATFTSGVQSITVEARYNTNTDAQLNGLSPDASGVILVNFTKNSTNNFLLNAVKLEEYTNGGILKPINLVTEPLINNSSVRLRWSDRGDSETGYEISRSVSPGSGFSVLTTTTSNATTYVDNSSSLVPGTTYYYRVRQRKGSSYSSYSNTAKFSLAKSLVLVNMNIPGFSQAAPWNNTNDPTSDSGVVINNLLNTNNIYTGADFMIVKAFFGKGFEGVNSTTGILPALVMRSDYFTDGGAVSAVKFSGLDMRQTYRIGVFSSIVEKTGLYFAIYTINGVSKSINGQSNSTNMVYFDNIRPNDQGEIVISVSPDNQLSPYCFTNAFTLEGYVAPDDVPSGALHFSNSSALESTMVVSPEIASAASPEEDSIINSVKLVAYPNPFTSALKAEVELPGNVGRAVLEVIDAGSRPVYRKEITTNGNGGGKQSIVIPISKEWAPGLYILKLSADNKIKTLKVIKVK